MKMKFLLSIILFLVFIFTACEKDEILTRPELLTAHPWTYDKIFKNGVDITEESLANTSGNRIFYFNPDGAAEIYFANNPSIGAIPAIWALADNEQTLLITISPPPFTWSILRLNEQELWVQDVQLDTLSIEYHLKPSN